MLQSILIRCKAIRVRMVVQRSCRVLCSLLILGVLLCKLQTTDTILRTEQTVLVVYMDFSMRTLIIASLVQVHC